MGYYFVIMVFHIYIARSERNCNKKKLREEKEKNMS